MPELLLKEAIDLFLGDKKESTADSYRPVLYRFCDWVGSARQLPEILPLDMDRYFQSQIKPHDYAVATYNKHIKTLRTFFNWYVKRDVIEQSPVRHIQYKKKPQRVDRDNAITDEELERVIETARNKALHRNGTHGSPRSYALVLFAADSGARPGEIASMTAESIDFPNGSAVVEGKVGLRVVWFGSECANAIRSWLSWRSGRYDLVGNHIWSLDGSHLRASGISQIIRRACLDAGVRSMGTYYFRHYKGYQFSDNGTGTTIAATAMGHSPQTYWESYGARDLDAAEKASRELTYRPKIKKFSSGKTDQKGTG